MNRLPAVPVLAALALAACVPVPPELMPQISTRSTTTGVFPGLDPGGAQDQSLHFSARAYGGPHAKEVLGWAEEDYERIMRDTGLYSFKPMGLYEVAVYATQDEYRRKTEQPDWSGGVTVGNSIYSFDGPGLGGTLAHEMTHLVFNEYMGPGAPNLRWLNEGLAVYEESQAASGPLKAEWEKRFELARANPMPFSQMTNLVPASERERTVSQWYPQVGSVVQFLLQHGGSLGFGQLLTSLKSGQTFDNAVRGAYPGVWADTGGLETAWKRG